MLIPVQQPPIIIKASLTASSGIIQYLQALGGLSREQCTCLKCLKKSRKRRHPLLQGQEFGGRIKTLPIGISVVMQASRLPRDFRPADARLLGIVAQAPPSSSQPNEEQTCPKHNGQYFKHHEEHQMKLACQQVYDLPDHPQKLRSKTRATPCEVLE